MTTQAPAVLLDTEGTPLSERTPLLRVVEFTAPAFAVARETVPYHRFLVPELSDGETTEGVERRAGARHDLRLVAGDVIAVPAGLSVGLEWHAPLRAVALHIDAERIAQFAAAKVPVGQSAELRARLAAGPAVLHDPELADAAIRLALALRRGGPGAEALAEALSIAFLVTMLRNHGRDMESDPALRFFPAVAALIERRMHAQVSVAEMAKAAAMSESAFARAFRSQTGITPAEHLRRARVERARVRLAEGARPAEVAIACGFSDQAHLTRVFKSITGETPAAFRKRTAA